MEWSNDLVLEFLDLFQQEDVIWNACHKMHKNRNAVYDAWRRIREQMSTDCSVEELKKKKDSLMASFRTCLHKMRTTTHSGTGVDDVYRPQWFAFAKMASFLREKDKPRKTINSEVIEPESGTQDEIHVDNETDDHTITEELPITAVSVAATNNTTTTTATRTSLKKRTTNSRDETLLHNRMDEAYSILTSGVQNRNTKKDELDLYGELVTAKLRKLDEPSRDIMMHRIDNLFFDMKMRSSDKNYQTQTLTGYQSSSTPCCSRSSSVATPLQGSLPHQASPYTQSCHYTELSPLSQSTSYEQTENYTQDGTEECTNDNVRHFYESFE